ncbi:MAG: hypothetical protein R3B35_13625 [Gemmatimonadales bacterium]
MQSVVSPDTSLKPAATSSPPVGAVTPAASNLRSVHDAPHRVVGLHLSREDEHGVAASGDQGTSVVIGTSPSRQALAEVGEISDANSLTSLCLEFRCRSRITVMSR